ncbi:MAG TPA: HEAT repeat domain-containing protein, partial [Verrucomicrobiae bacterium]|nr:HEAT repeat domain-containing protein [Verrucomicrobiae bacterium]
GDAFVADPAENIVHHKKVVHTGPTARAERPRDEQKVEFLASRDTWFRPVFMANAPDGTLYICDMYREIIEALGIPDEIARHLDFDAGADMGRIYRVAPDGFKQPPPPRLSRASLKELVATLEHPNGWHRDTATRLLYERNDSAAAPMLTKLAAESKSALARLHALYALQGLGALEERLLLQRLSDSDGAVREHAVRLSEGFLQNGVPSPELWKKLRERAADPVSGVRYQLAFTLGEVRHRDRLEALTEIARRDSGEPMMRAAILSSLAEGAGEMFDLLADENGEEGRPEMLRELAAVIGAANRPDDVGRVRQVLISKRDPLVAFPIARGLGNGLRRAGSSFEKSRVDLKPLLDRAAALAVDPSADEPTRLEAIGLLAFSSGSETAITLLSLISALQPHSLQMAALTALDRVSPGGLGSSITERWSSFTPTIREKAVDVLLKRTDRTGDLLDTMEHGVVQRRDLSLMQAVALRQHSDASLQRRAIKVIGAATNGNREDVVGRFRAALELRGDVHRGEALFQRRCQSCHRLGNDGFAVGPDLAGARHGGKEKLLANILDPNREVPPNYFGYTVETKEADSYAGLIVNETAGSITIRQPFGVETVVARGQIATMKASKLSLMPEGLEEGLGQQDMADLMDFILTENP